ncbi:probable methyltransferase PMT24 [Tanacetum coccineum]
MARDMATWLESPPYWLKSSEVGVYGKPVVPKFTVDDKNRFGNQTITVSSSTLLKLDWSKIKKHDRSVTKGARAIVLRYERAEKSNLFEREKGFQRNSASHVIVLFGLSASANVSPLAHDLLLVLSNEDNGAPLPVVVSYEYTLRAMVLETPHGDLMACLEMTNACMHKVPLDEPQHGAKWTETWSQRLESPTYWLKSREVGVYGKPAPDDFTADYEHWKHVVSKSYLNGLGIDWSSVRNVMDMRSIYGG